MQYPLKLFIAPYLKSNIIGYIFEKCVFHFAFTFKGNNEFSWFIQGSGLQVIEMAFGLGQLQLVLNRHQTIGGSAVLAISTWGCQF